MIEFASDAEVYDAAVTLLKDEHLTKSFCYGIAPISVVRASAAERLFVVRAAVGPVDEGWMATMADYLTSVGIGMFTGSIMHVSTALSLRMLAPVRPETRSILIECAVDFCDQPPHATAVFRDAERPDTVYATASHSKFLKGAPPPRL